MKKRNISDNFTSFYSQIMFFSGFSFTMGLRAILAVAFAFVFTITIAFSAEEQADPIIFPKEHSIVGARVNLVLDPTEIPFFQVIVGKTEYPVVDTSTGRHAYQGLELEPGVNTIIVKVFAPSPQNDKNSDNKDLALISRWERKVFSKVALSSGKAAPVEFQRELFHSRERETSCSGCHNLEAPPGNSNSPKSPEDMICYVCHRKIPTGKHIHGPAAVWVCTACHDPEIYPVKYQFASIDPWKASKTTQAVEPMVFTVSTADLFKGDTAALVSMAKAKDTLAAVLNYVKQNPSDMIRLEVHTDNTPLKKPKKTKKGTGFKDKESLTTARAKTLSALLKKSGVAVKRISAVGMGDKLPRTPNKTKEQRELNSRVEIVVYPPDVKIINSQKLPILKDRERVVITISYSQGPQLKKLRIAERVPKGLSYIKGTGILKGKAVDPTFSGDLLIWELDDTDGDFAENLIYTIKKGKETESIPTETRVIYVSKGREQSREFDYQALKKPGITIKETCLKCHEPVIKGEYRHGPVESGYCIICHNPHASRRYSGLVKSPWDLCTTCHTEKASGAHVIAGATTGKSHPTQKKRDPSRPGKRLSCASCHEPHSAASPDLFAYDAKVRGDLCGRCHKKK